MPRGISNWSYKDVTSFLSEHSFVFFEQKEGSHEAWICEATEAIVEINFHGKNKAFPERTLETMIRQSKINKKEWRKWASQ